MSEILDLIFNSISKKQKKNLLTLLKNQTMMESAMENGLWIVSFCRILYLIKRASGILTRDGTNWFMNWKSSQTSHSSRFANTSTCYSWTNYKLPFSLWKLIRFMGAVLWARHAGPKESNVKAMGFFCQPHCCNTSKLRRYLKAFWVHWWVVPPACKSH